MKIVDRKTFLALPAGVLYREYKRHDFGDLHMKHETVAGIDWCSDSLTMVDEGECDGVNRFYWEVLEDACDKGTRFRFEYDVATRDGCFEEGQLFAVYEADDIEQLMAVLLKAVPAEVK